jgi:small subunit ribosomal protein S20
LANIKSAIKRARQGEKRRKHNASQRSFLRTQIKNVLKSIKEGNAAEAQKVLSKAQSVIDKAVKIGLIHTNKASRHKSRLSAKIKALAA